MANLEIAGAHKRTQKGNVDYYYGGENEAWADLASAKAGVPSSIRPGKTVGVYVSGEIVEYWWPDATHIGDADLIVKEVPLPQALGTADSPTFGNITANGGLAITQSGNSFTSPPIAITNEGDTAGTNSNVLDITLVNPSDPTKKKHFIFRATVPTTVGGNYALQLPEPSLGAATLATTFDITTAVGAANHYRGKYASLSALQTAISSGVDGDYAIVTGSPNDQEYIWDSDHSAWTLTAIIPAGTFAGLGGSPTDNGALASALAAKVDVVSGYGMISSTDQTKLNGIASGATANSAAAQSDVTTGTDSVKYLTSSLWTWIKTQVQTIAGIWNFSNGLQVGGNTVETQNNKDASGGYAGLTSFKINFKNAANTFTSFFTNANTASRTYTFKDRNGTILDDTDGATFVDLTSNQTAAGNKTLTGLTSIQSATPEQRFVTSGDSQYARFQRTAALSNNLFIGKNQVQQVGGVGRAVWFNTQNCYYTGNDTGLPSGNNNMQVTVAFAYKVPAGVINCFFQQTFVGAGVGNTFGLRYGDRTWYLQIGGTEVATSYYGNIDGNWHGFIFTLTNKTYAFYLDNVLITSGTFVNNYTVTNAGTSTSMQSSFTNAINNGIQLDQLLIYNRVLTRTSGPGGTDEVAQIYNSGGFTASPPTSGLVRRYEFEEGTGTTTADINPNFTQYPLTLVNSFQWLPTGIVPVAAASSEAMFLSVADGISNGEKGIATWGDFSGRNQQQGKWFQFFQGTNYPLVSNNSGQWLFNSANTVATLPIIGSTIDIAGNLTVGSYAGTAAPTNGLIVSGTTGLGTSSPSSSYILDMVGPARSQGIFTTYGTTPELRWTTSDTKFATSTRNATNNALTFSNNVQQAGGAGGCLNFLAANTQTVTVPVIGLATAEFNFTVSIIFKTTQTHGGLIYIQSSTGAGFRAGVEFNGSTIIYTNNGGSGDQATVTVNDGQWHLVVLDYGVGGTVHLYVDNVLKGTSTSTLSTGRLIPNTITIGSANLTGSASFPFTGSIAQFCIWTSVLGPTDRGSLWSGGSFTSTPPTASSTLVRDYEFQDGSGSFAHDNSSATVNGTLVNSPTWMGPGNGIIAQSATATSSTFLRVIDGVNANERGQVFLSDPLAGTRIQGYTIKHFINNGIPFIADNIGNILISPSNTSETVRSLSALGVAGGTSIGSTYATTNAAPTDGLIVQGKSAFGATTNSGTSFMTLSGNVTAASNLGVGLLINTTFKQSGNSDSFYAIDTTGATFTNAVNQGGTLIGTLSITNAGSGYTNGSYNAVSVTGGSGTGATINVTISGGVVTSVNLTTQVSGGSGYVTGDVCSVATANLGGTGSGFTFAVTGTIFLPGTVYGIRNNFMVPSANNTGSLGVAGLAYSNIYSTTINLQSLKAGFGGSFVFINGGSTTTASYSSSSNNWIFGTSTTETNYKVAINNTGTSGSLLVSGSVSASSNIARGAYFNNTLNAVANNDVLVGLDVDTSFGLGTAAIQTLGTITAGSGYTNGTYNGVSLTGGAGTGATANITVAGNIVTVVTLVNRGGGYAVSNTLSATIAGGSGFSIPVTAIGLSGVTSFSLRTSGDIQLGGKLAIPTGSNKSAGTATLVSGTVTISNTLVTANSMIMLSYRNPSGTIGAQLSQGIIMAGTSFIVNSLDTSSSLVTSDNNTFNWWIIN